MWGFSKVNWTRVFIKFGSDKTTLGKTSRAGQIMRVFYVQFYEG